MDLVPPTALDATCASALTGPYADELPVPHDVLASADDRTVTLQWNGPLTWLQYHDDDNGDGTPDDLQGLPKVEGYRVCWGPSQDELRHGALFWNRIGQLFMPNGQTNVAVVQAVDPKGRVSRPSEVVQMTADPSRVDALRTQMTGFFDDFNLSAGALDERRWNVAFSTCTDPLATSTYIHGAGHAVSLLSNTSNLPGFAEKITEWAVCDRPQNIARPRAVLDFTGREARVVFDLDGTDGDRHTWYLDVFPYEGQEDLIDITGHVTFDPGPGHPGRFLRFSQGGPKVIIHQLAANGEALNVVDAEIPPQIQVMQGVMRRWELRIAKNYAAIYINGELVLENSGLALDFERGFIHWAQFGYNPIKQGKPWARLAWDNFGFDGPATPLVTHNYKQTFTGADRLNLSDGMANVKSWEVTIPDTVAGAQTARVHYSMQVNPHNGWTASWSPDDHFVLNGQRFAMPEPISETGLRWQDQAIAQIAIGGVWTPFSTFVTVPTSVLKTGANTFEFAAAKTTLINLHVELDYPSGEAPAYSQPGDYLQGSAALDLPELGPTSAITALNGDGQWSYDIPADGSPTVVRYANPLSGQVTVSLSADNFRNLVANGHIMGCSRVELLVDNEVVERVDTAESVAAPEIDSMDIVLDTTTFPNGQHELAVIVYDSAGNAGRPWYGQPGSEAQKFDPYFPILVTFEN